MHIIKPIFYILFFLIINPAYSLSNDKIAYINLELIIENTNYGKKILLKLDEENQKNLNKLSKYESELKKNEDLIKQKKNILSNEEYNKEVNLLKKKILSYREQKKDIVNNFTNFKNKQIKEYFNKINPFIQDYMKKNSISLLFDQKNVFIGKTESDITSDLIKIINEKIKL